MVTPPISPVRYDPSVEHPEPDEAATGQALVETMRSIIETTYKDYGHAVRSVHAKSHGLLQGEMTVLDGLPETLAQGLFSAPRTYGVVLRFSTTPGDILDDKVSTPRGLAIKAIGTEGERLPGSEGQVTQDFVMVNGPAFGAPTAKAFLGNLKLLAATTDKAESLKKALSFALRGVEFAVEAFGGQSGLLKTLGGHPLTNPLGEIYFTQAPLRYGDYIAKISVAPVSPELRALTGAKVDLSGKPDGLRDSLVNFFASQRGEWEIRAQLCADLESMPVEDSSVVWPEDKSPYVPVGRIKVEPQEAWSAALSSSIDDGLSFSPWHGLAAHRPLGSIMRVRKAAYEMSAGFRSSRNECPVREPRVLADVG